MLIKTKKFLLASAIGFVSLAAIGCERDLSLAQRTWAPRPEQTLAPVAPPQAQPIGRRDVRDVTTGEIKIAEAPVGGTYMFTVPETVTQVKNPAANFGAYQLFMGNPKPNDRPFISIEIGPDVVSEAEVGGAGLKAENTRKYGLNGLSAEEWTGKTSEGYPFCELIVTRGDNGDRLHALAIAKDKNTRQVALDILASIKWEPKK